MNSLHAVKDLQRDELQCPGAVFTPLIALGGLKRTGEDSYSIVFENAPQIEITIDGGAVFQNGWKALSNGAEDLEKDNLNVNDYYFDRMKYSPSLDLESFLREWNNA